MTESHPNGVDVQQLGATIEAVKADPALANFQVSGKHGMAIRGACKDPYSRVSWSQTRRHLPIHTFPFGRR